VFFENKKRMTTSQSVTEHPEPPGFRGNGDDGYVLKGVVRKNADTVE
jgi:putative transposase